jgi:hypothetical protein
VLPVGDGDAAFLYLRLAQRTRSWFSARIVG